MAKLVFEIIGDDTDVRKKLKELSKLQSESGQAFQKAFKGGGEGAKSIQDTLKQILENTKKATTATAELNKAQSSSQTNAAKEAQLAYMDSLRQSRLEIQKQREEQARLRVALDEGRISQQQYRIEAAKFSLEERKKAAALRETKKEISNNSEYQKLNRALGNLRTESKNLLAEMYRLETQGKKGSTAYQELANKARGVTAQTKVLDGALKKIDASLGLHQRNVGNYGSALDAVSPQFARLNSQLSMMGVNLTELAGNKNAFRELGTTIAGVGRSLLTFLISPIGLAITAIGGFFALIRGNKGTVMEFNSGLLNVSKTTGIAGAALDKLGDDVVGLSRKLQTVSTDKLLEYATVAGQLGVKGSQNIMAFTEALAKLETASDITGEKGGAEIARLLTLTDGGVQNVKDFGDEIVNLGNNFAATESEILSNATAIAQNTGLYKVGRQDVLAYATATKAVGLEAEVVGSAMFRTLAQIEKYSNGAKGSEKILSLLGKTQTELSKQFKTDSSGVFNDLIAALNKIDKEGGNVTATLNQLGLNNVRDIRVLGTLASSGYGQLEQAMIDVKDAAGAMDDEFNRASEKLVKQTERIGIAWDNLVLNVENGTGAIGRSAVVISDLLATMLEGITNLVTSDSWGEFWERVNPKNWGKGQSISDIKEWSAALKEARDYMTVDDRPGTGSTWIENEFRALSKGDFNKNLEETISIYESLKQASIDYEAAVLSGRVKEKKETVAHYVAQENALKVHISNLKGIQSELGYGETATPASGGSATVPLTEAEIAAQARAHETMVNAQRAMQAKIDEMNQSAKRRSTSDSEEEVQAIKDKYAKLTEEAQRFNADPKNKIKVNLSGLGASESGEISEANYKADTVLLKKGLDEQLKLYNDFEALRKATSTKVAEERYKDQLGLIRDYEPKLQAEIAKLEGKDRSKEEEKRYRLLQEDQKKFNEARLKEEETSYAIAYNLSKTHAQSLLDIEEKYKKARKDLGDKASKEQLDVLNKGEADEISALTLAEVHKYEIYKKANEQAILLTREQIKEQIKALRTLLESGDISDEIKDKIQSNIEGLEFSLKIGVDESNIRELEKKKNEIVASIQEIKLENISSPEIEKELQRLIALLAETQIEIDAINDKGLKKFFDYLKGDAKTVAQGLSDDLKEISGSFYELSDALGGVDTSAGYTLDTIGQLVEVGSDAAGAFASFASGDIVGGITKTVKAVTGLFSISKKVKEMNAAARKEVKEYYENAIKGEKAYQDALKARELQIIRNNKVVLDGIRDEMALRSKMNNEASKEADDIIKKLGSMNYVSGETYKHGTWFRKAKVNKEYTSLAGLDYDQLHKLLLQGKLDGEAKVLVERLVELENQGVDTTQVLADLAKEVESIFTGTTSDNLSSALANMFKEGKTGADDLAKFFEESMKQSMLSTFKNTVLDEAMADFYKKFAEGAMSGEALTDEEITALWDDFLAKMEVAQEEWDRFLELSGLSFDSMDGTIRDIGISLESVQSQFAALFANGTASAEEFGNNFEEIMKSVIMNSFQTNFVAEAMKGFYQQILDLTESGNDLTEAEITLLRSQYESIVAEGQERFAQLEKVTGMSFAVKEEIEEIKKEIDKVFSGFGDTIVDSLTKPFDQVGDAFEDTMKKAILSTFRDGVLEKELQEFYQMYADMTEGGASLNAAQVDLLRAKYDEILERGKASIAELEQLTGVALKEIEKIEEVIRENLTGTSLEGVADSIANMFSQGKNEAIDFAETFEEVMKKAVLNIFKTNLIAGELKNFYDTFEQIAQSDEGLTAANMAELRLQYDLMMAGADARFRELEKVTGLSFEVIEAVQEAVEIARESIVGTTFESFADGIVEMLARGTTSVQEFGKSFEETMKTAILNTFKTKTLAREMEAFYDQFYRYTDSGGMLTEVEIAALKVQYDKMIKDGRDKLDQIERVTGMDFTTETSATGMAGAIRRELTEQTAGELKGLYRAQYDISKSLLQLQAKEWAAANNYNRIGIERLTAIQANTFRTAENTEHNKRLINIESHLARMSGASGGLSANKYI